MSKRTKKRDPADGIAAAVPPLERAIAECVGAWQSRFERVPTTRELVRPFEVVLASGADELVEDSAAVSATWLPPHAAARSLALTAESNVTVKLAGWWGLDQIELVLPPPRSGMLKCILEAAGDVVLVDYDCKSLYPHPPEDEARAYILRHAIPPWAAAREVGPFARALCRSFDTLSDPIEIELSQS